MYEMKLLANATVCNAKAIKPLFSFSVALNKQYLTLPGMDTNPSQVSSQQMPIIYLL